jgi:hypothetical protein
VVEDTRGMLKIVADFYKVLFGREDKSSLSLKEDFWDVGDKVTEEENEELQAPFLEDEVKAVVFSRYQTERAYDRVNLNFLLENLRLRGFSEKWIG